jgi:hypothetical protein
VGIYNTCMRVYVVRFHGVQKIADSVKDTEAIAATTEPRWMSWLMAEYSKDTVLNALPRVYSINTHTHYISSFSMSSHLLLSLSLSLSHTHTHMPLLSYLQTFVTGD